MARGELFRDLPARRAQLADAHLHLALSYVALNDPGAAKESLKAMVRADPSRRLDPEVYAPKVIELFEEARSEVVKEAARSPAEPARSTEKKGRSKAIPILLGAGGAAAATVALAAGGNGGGAPPNATTAPPSAAIGPEDIVFLSSSPPPGSTLSVSRRDVLTMTFSVIMDRDERDVIVRLNFSQGEGGPCIPNPASDSAPFSLTRGQPRTVTVSVPASAWREEIHSRCTLPVSPPVTAWVQSGTCNTRPSGSCITKEMPVSYPFAR